MLNYSYLCSATKITKATALWRLFFSHIYCFGDYCSSGTGQPLLFANLQRLWTSWIKENLSVTFWNCSLLHTELKMKPTVSGWLTSQKNG